MYYVLYFLYKRQFRVILGAIIGGFVCTFLLASLVFGIQNNLGLLADWFGVILPYIKEGTGAEGLTGFRHTNQSLNAVFFRFFTETAAEAGRENFYINLVSLNRDAALQVRPGLEP